MEQEAEKYGDETSEALSENDRREPSDLEAHALYARLKGWYKSDFDHSLKWRKEAKECFALLQYAIEAGDGNRQPADR